MSSAHFLCLVSLHELVKHEENGLIFKDSKELSEQLKVRHLLIKKLLYMTHKLKVLYVTF